MKNTLWFLLATALVLASSCTKDSNKGGDINVEDFYAEVVIDGDTINMTDRLNGYTNGVGSGGGVADSNSHYLFRQLTEFAGTQDTLRIYFIKIFNSPPDAAAKEAVVHSGSYLPGNGTADVILPGADLEDGAAIVYIAPDGTRWVSDRTPTAQPNWNFNVTSHTENDIDNFSKYITDITFTGKLYNLTTGASVDINVVRLRARTIAE